MTADSSMGRCLLVFLIITETLDGILRTAYSVTYSALRMTTLTRPCECSEEIYTEDKEDSFSDLKLCIVPDEEESECSIIDDLKVFDFSDEPFPFPSVSSPYGDSSSFSDRKFESVSSVRPSVSSEITESTSSSVIISPTLDVLSRPKDYVANINDVTSSFRLDDQLYLVGEVRDDVTPSCPLHPDNETSDTASRSSCDTVVNVLSEKKHPSSKTPGPSNGQSQSTYRLSSTVQFNEFASGESEFRSMKDIFSLTEIVLGSKIVSLITRQYLRETISARSSSLTGDSSSNNTPKKPDEVDTVRRDRKKQLNRDWAKRDRAKRQDREKQLKQTIARLNLENKKLEIEMRMLKEDLVSFKKSLIVHRLFCLE